MDYVLIIGAVVLIVFIYRKLTTSTNSDKLTLLQLENWVPMYRNGSLFQKSTMATALVVQSINMANGMGVYISVNEFMREKNRNKISSIETVDEWLSYIFSDMTRDIPLSQLNTLPARSVGAMMLISLLDRERFRALVSGG